MIYVFLRNKKTGKKKIIAELNDESEAKKMCKENTTSKHWCEFTRDKEYTR